MESLLQASEVKLVDSLKFEAPPVASYITDRSQVRVAPLGGSTYACDGTTSMKFQVSTTGPFVDCSTFAIQGKLVNKAGDKALQMLGASIESCIREIRFSCGNVECERLQHYARFHRTMQLLESVPTLCNSYSEGVGLTAGAINTSFQSTPLAQGTSRDFIFRPKLGIMQSHLYLPTAFLSGGGCVMEVILETDPAAGVQTGGDKSTSYEIQSPFLLFETVSVDPSLMTRYSAHLLEGGSMTMHFSSFDTSLHSIVSQNAQLVHAKANTRLKAILLSFFGGGDDSKKVANQFYLPANQALSFRTQVGEKSNPDNPVRSLSEFYMRLMNLSGAAKSASHSISMTRSQFATTHFLACQDFEKVGDHQAAASGINTFNSQLQIALENISADGANLPTLAYLTSFFDVALEITSSGVTVSV